MPKKITDFGEKISGARKDLWALRGLLVSDFTEMTDEEVVKITSLHKVLNAIISIRLLMRYLTC